MKLFVVGDGGPEHNLIKSIHKTYDGAFKAWNELRLSLLEDAKNDLKNDPECASMRQKTVDELSCTDPKETDCGLNTPYIREYELHD